MSPVRPAQRGQASPEREQKVVSLRQLLPESRFQLSNLLLVLGPKSLEFNDPLLLRTYGPRDMLMSLLESLELVLSIAVALSLLIKQLCQFSGLETMRFEK
jgi:hypothetical protein